MMNARQLEKYQRRLYNRIPLIGGWLRRRAAQTLAQDSSPGAVQALAEAVTRSDDKGMRRIALEALQQLADRGSTEVQEALCSLVIKHDHPIAREIAVAAQYAPRDPRQRALFYFLTEQWEKYESLDFDQALLRATYEVAEEGLRRRILDRARQAGRVEWVRVVVGGRQERRLGEMTDEEWEAALAVLGRSERWEDMWQLAQVAPAMWSVQLLQRLGETGWVPREEWERTGFAELVCLAERCVGEWSGPGGAVCCLATLEHQSRVNCLAISPDGRLLASGSRDNTVQLWSLPDRVALKTLEEHTGKVECLAISPDGRVLASGSRDRTVRLWSLPDGTPLKTLARHEDWVSSLAITPDGRVLASGSLDNTVRLWSLPDGAALKMLAWYYTTRKGYTRAVGCLAITPDGRLLASGSYDLPLFPHVPPTTGESDDTPVRVWNLPRGRVLMNGIVDRTVQLWSLSDGMVLKMLKGHTDDVKCLAISPDGRVLASGSMDHTVRLWHLPDGAALKTLEGHTNPVQCLVISPDGRLLASGSADHTVRLWRFSDGVALKTLEEHTNSVACLAISPDGWLLASGSGDKTVRLWELKPLHLSHLPVAQISLEDMAWVQEALRDGEISDAERGWLEFLLALMHWQRRFDVEVEEAPRRISVGEFDIEIE